MKKLLSMLLVVSLVISLAACNQKNTESTVADKPSEQSTTSTQNENATTPTTTDQEPVTLNIFQFKVEIVEQLDSLITDFEAAYPYIDVVIDTVGGGQDYGGSLKTRMNSGNEPDIFNIGGPTELILWEDYLEPLTNEPWVENAFDGTLDMVTRDGEVYGQPYNVEGYGLIYNIDMFETAGIDPTSITSLTALREAFATLESKKADLGIDKVLSFSVGDSAWWTAAIHAFNVPFAKQEKPFEFVEALNQGTATLKGNDRFEGYLNLLDLYFEYSYDDLMTVSYDDQYANFALGKTALLHQGNWTINQLNEIEENMNIAFLPVPLSDDPSWENDTIMVGVPSFWAVNSNAADANKAAAKLFLDYMASSERGAEFIVNDCKFIPAFSNITLEAGDPLSQSIQAYSQAGKTSPWVWMYTPDGFIDPVSKEGIQKYYLGEFSKDDYLEFLDTKYQELVKAK